MAEYNAIATSPESVGSPAASDGEDDVRVHNPQNPSWRRILWLNRRFLIIALTPILCSPIAIIVANPVSCIGGFFKQ